MDKLTVVNSLLVLVLSAATVGLWLGRKRGRPPGRKGLAGTSIEHSEPLRRLQLALLGVLVVACVATLLIFNVPR